MEIAYMSLLIVCLVGISCIIINQLNLMKIMNEILNNQDKIQRLNEINDHRIDEIIKDINELTNK